MNNLLAAGFVDIEKRDGKVYYQLAEDRIERFLKERATCWSNRIFSLCSFRAGGTSRSPQALSCEHPCDALRHAVRRIAEVVSRIQLEHRTDRPFLIDGAELLHAELRSAAEPRAWCGFPDRRGKGRWHRASSGSRAPRHRAQPGYQTEPDADTAPEKASVQ